MNNKIGLVLEGGGFRGLYTAGILDYFLEQDIQFPYVIGVSMGANNACNYLSKQIGRSLDVPYRYINDKRYFSYWRLFTRGQLFGMDFIFNDIPKELVPFDYQTFENSPTKLVFVATDCNSGEPAYFINSDIDISLSALEASISLPFASKKVKLNGQELLDGGISDPIPFQTAFDDGCEKVVVILTQPEWYRKEASNFKLMGNLFYKKYPKLIQALQNRHMVYNQQIEELQKLQQQGKAFIIQPKDKLPISRIEKDKEKLKETYQYGYKQSCEFIEHLMEFINE